MVGTLDDIHVMLDDDNGVSAADQGIEGFQQLLDVVEMQTGSRLVEYEDGRGRFLDAEEIS